MSNTSATNINKSLPTPRYTGTIPKIAVTRASSVPPSDSNTGDITIHDNVPIQTPDDIAIDNLSGLLNQINFDSEPSNRLNKQQTRPKPQVSTLRQSSKNKTTKPIRPIIDYNINQAGNTPYIPNMPRNLFQPPQNQQFYNCYPLQYPIFANNNYNQNPQGHVNYGYPQQNNPLYIIMTLEEYIIEKIILIYKNHNIMEIIELIFLAGS